MHSSFGDDVSIESVTEIDRVDVVAFEIRVPVLKRKKSESMNGAREVRCFNIHYGEEHLKEQVDGIQ